MPRFYIFLCICVAFSLDANGLLPESTPVTVTGGMYNVKIGSNALIYYDRSKSITYHKALKLLAESKFSPWSDSLLPNKLIRGLYHNWIYFSLQNVDSLPIPIILNGELACDSIFILKDKSMIFSGTISHDPVKDNIGILNVGISNSFFYMLQRNSKIEVLIRHDDYSYSSGSNLPKVSDLRVYEAKYFHENNRLILFYMSGVFISLTILLIFGFQWIFTRERAYLWYSLYALANLFVIWRNLEDIHPYLYSTLQVISWAQSKVFHSIAIFYTYIVFCASFLGYTKTVLKNVITILTLICILFILTEVIFIIVDYDLYYRWLFYKFVRLVLTIYGIGAIIIAVRPQHPLLKYIVAGGSLMALAEIVSIFFGGQTTSAISLVGIYSEFILFSVALGVRANLLTNEKISLKLENLRLAREREQVAMNLKSRIANDIHDELGAGLTSANFVLHSMMNENNNSVVDTNIKRILSLNNTMVTQMHDLIWSMDSSKDTIEDFCADVRSVVSAFLDDNGLKGEFNCDYEDGKIGINGLLRRNLLMCIKEMLTNAAKHSGANRVDIKMATVDGTLSIQVVDNGKGFSERSSLKPMAGNGIKSIIKRVKECGGTVDFSISGGAEILIQVPIG